MSFGSYLRERREEIGSSQREIADFLSEYGFATSAQAVSHWETGRRDPSGLHDPAFMRVLAAALETDVAEIFSRIGYVTSAEDLPALARQAAEIVLALKPEHQLLAIRFLRMLAQYEKESVP